VPIRPVDSNLTEEQQVSGGLSDEVVTGSSVGPVGSGVGFDVVVGPGGSGDRPFLICRA